MGQCSSQPHVTDAKHRLDDAVGEDMSELLTELASVTKRTNEKIYKTPLKHPALINIGMIAMQCVRENREAPTSGTKFSSDATLMRAVRYARYAKAAYSDGEEEIVKVLQGDEEDFGGNVEMLHVDKPSGMDPGFFIARDKGTGEIVLSIRGKGTAKEDAIGGFARDLAPFMEGNTAKSLLSASDVVMNRAKAPLENAFKTYPESAFAIVGHGVGAGLAVLCTLQAFGKCSPVEQGKSKCYAFGPPPVFEPIDKLPADHTKGIFTFVNGMDCVPRVSPDALGKLLLAVKKVDELEVDTPERLKTLGTESNNNNAEETLLDSVDLPEDLSTEFKSLRGVGTILHLSKVSGKMNCSQVSSDQTEKILFHSDMAKDHAIESYEESIAEVVMDIQKKKSCC